MRHLNILFLSFLLWLPAAKADTISTIGDIGQIALPLSGALATYYYKDKAGLWQLAKAYGTTLGIVYVLKPTVDRPRPDGGTQSFPSGHTASAFAGAAFLQRRYGWAFGAPAYLLAGFVGYSRVHARRHWTSDVIVGAGIGVFSNFLFTKPYHGMTITPYGDSQGGGIMVQGKIG